MSSNYAHNHGGNACSEGHLREHHTPGYLREGVDDANLDGQSKIPNDQPGLSRRYRTSGSEGSQLTSQMRSQQFEGPQKDMEYEPPHNTSHDRYRPHNESGEPHPADRVAGKAEEVAGFVAESPSLEKRGESRFEKGSKQD